MRLAIARSRELHQGGNHRRVPGRSVKETAARATRAIGRCRGSGPLRPWSRRLECVRSAPSASFVRAPYRHTGIRKRQEHLSTATTMYREMAMRFWLEKAEAEVAAISCRLPPDR